MPELHHPIYHLWEICTVLAKMSIHPEQYRLVHYGQAQKGVASPRA
jgi:hypothetical protein